ncbi:MarR family winged helix-turn-helix transcriptional regulator [Luteibacter aegosomaticola]|jgi:DNA-binding MarR family transcriptional regulator|uniref:MarR family winged helix-turn-helix transcriptional regulator n=1 Tax=Luteibacter aegosomaticola TaxID=2911538 RepID=UPI001FF90817|nr:MarR family winged helix-turn-helix transcriptional regulator [Luteibacter aegosomaticola]UPG91074.1 MarR family winged helix-turn-helix transcriptional regulator [Luteibacter aegosomaticola]
MTLEPVPAHAPLELEHFLPYRLSILSNTVSQSIADEYQGRFQLSMTEWRVMTILARFPASSATQVVERTRMDKVAVSRAVARLVEAGRIDRGTFDGDKRRSVLNLSEAGWAIHDEVAPLARAHERELLEKLSEDEKAWLEKILDKLLGP